MTEITITEVASELQRGYRTFKCFENGLEMARILIEAQNKKVDLERSIAQLEDIKNNLEDELDAEEATIDALEAHAEEAERRLENINEVMSGKVEDILKSAREEAENIIRDAVGQKSAIESEIISLKKEAQMVSQVVAEESNRLSELRKSIEAEKDRLKKMFS